MTIRKARVTFSKPPEIGEKIRMVAQGTFVNEDFDGAAGIVKSIYNSTVSVKMLDDCNYYYKADEIINFTIAPKYWHYELLHNEWNEEENI